MENLDPDQDLVDAWVNQADPAALERLVARHQEYVFRVALSVLGPAFAADAEDVAQEVFIRAARHLQEFRGESRFRTWLHRLALNLALDRRRRPRWRNPHVDPGVLDRRATTARGDDPFLSVEAAERRRVVHQCLEALPDGLRSVIHLRYWLDLQVDDIATTLQIPLGTVKSHLQRGRRLLSRMMQANGMRPEALGGKGRAATTPTAPRISTPAPRYRRSGGVACLAGQA